MKFLDSLQLADSKCARFWEWICKNVCNYSNFFIQVQDSMHGLGRKCLWNLSSDWFDVFYFLYFPQLVSYIAFFPSLYFFNFSLSIYNKKVPSSLGKCEEGTNKQLLFSNTAEPTHASTLYLSVAADYPSLLNTVMCFLIFPSIPWCNMVNFLFSLIPFIEHCHSWRCGWESCIIGVCVSVHNFRMMRLIFHASCHG